MADDDLTAHLRWPADERGAPRRGPVRAASTPPAPRSAQPSPAGDGLPGDDELARLGHEVADLRRAIAELSERLDLRQLGAWLDELRTSLSRLTSSSEPSVALTPVLDELRELRREVVALRRRVALRTQADESVSDERLAELLEAVLDQRAGGRGRARRRR